MGGDFRLVQFTPPGSGCSIQFGANLTSAALGSLQSLYLIVSDIAAARDELTRRGVEVSEVFHEGAPGARFHDVGRVGGRSPEAGNSYKSFATFTDSEGNGWLFQEVTTRLPGRVDNSETSFLTVNDLVGALRRGGRRARRPWARTGKADANWPQWYADLMVREQAGEPLPS